MRFIQVLLERDIANQDEIVNFVDKVAERAEQANIKLWLKRNFRKWIIKTYKKVRPAQVGPTSPDWIKHKIEAGEQVHDVVLDDELKGKIDHVVDFFNATTPTRLERVSVEQAFKAADIWVKQLNKKASDEEVEDKDATTVLKWPDGYRIVKLLTKQGFEREGKMMGHCVGGYGYYDGFERGRLEIYSLRDPKNEPHTTMEIHGKQIHQIKGKQDRAPVAKYLPYLLEFIKKGKYEVVGDLHNVGFVKDIHGKTHHMSDLPNGFEYRGDLVIAGNMKRLPENMVINGNLRLDSLPNVKSLPKNLTVTGRGTEGKLIIDNVPITTIPAGVKFIHVHVENTNITEWPRDHLKVEGEISAPGFKGTTLPTGLTAESISFPHSNIEVIPLVHVEKNLVLNYSKLKELPKGLNVPAILDISNTPIKKLPNDLRVGITLDITETDIEELPESLKTEDAGGYMNGWIMAGEKIEKKYENKGYSISNFGIMI